MTTHKQTRKNEYFPQSVPHAGETLEEKLQEIKMGPKEFAIRTGKPEKTIIAILKGESAITPDMAVQFENVLGIPARFWMNAQRNYDEYKAKEKQAALIAESNEWAKLFPVREMLKLRWISPQPNVQVVSQLLAFFGVATPESWNNIYFKQELKVSFRISLAHTKEPYAIAAWLRKGELLAAEIQAKPYSEANFKDALLAIKSVMAEHPDDFHIQLQNICAEAGVKVVYTPCLPKAPINGATRWLNDTPLIQLSGRYKRNDAFWFTFFHEAGHILLHGKKDIFLEKVDYSEHDLEKEKEADEFAKKWTFSDQHERELLSNAPLTEAQIIAFAQKINTHPAMIIGRFQHDKKIPYYIGRTLFKAIDLGVCLS
jgi:HTH-type transcriptional regulator/antitoxin HigA